MADGFRTRNLLIHSQADTHQNDGRSKHYRQVRPFGNRIPSTRYGFRGGLHPILLWDSAFPRTDQMLCEDAIVQFVNDRQEYCAPATVRWYEDMLQPIRVIYGGRQVSEITPGDIQEYLKDQRHQEEGLSLHTMNSRRRAIRTFFSWAAKHNLTETNSAEGIHNLRTDHRRQPLTLEQVESVIKLLVNGDGQPWKERTRDLALFLFLYDTGCRRQEACRLTIESVNLDECYADVVGKGDKTRRVAFMPLTAKVLRNYIGGRYRGPLFLSEHRAGLTGDGLRGIFRRLSDRAKINVYPHLMRHTSAVHFLLNGGDVGDLQVLMGHSNITTTVHYVETARQVRALEAHREHSPVRGLTIDESQEELPRRAILRRVK